MPLHLHPARTLRNRKHRRTQIGCRGTAQRNHAISFEQLEPRVLFNATTAEIANALDLPQGTAVTYGGDAQAVAARILGIANGFLGFPSGRDEDFLYLSSGIADWVDTVANTGGSQGTDLGSGGAGGDTATISFTLPVPASTQPQRFKFDFLFASDEYPEFVGSNFNDFLTITVNGTNVALDEFGDLISVNNAFFTGAPATGTYFDGRTNFLTGVYPIPNNTPNLDVVISVGDVGDGIYDSAAILDNFRFETPQTIFLNFGGKTLVNHYRPGVSLTHPAFSATDLGFAAGDTAAKITEITNAIAGKFASYDVFVTNVMPASGDFMEVVIGGNNDIVVNISQMANPLLFNTFGATEPYQNILGAGSTLFGQAQRVDIGNQFRSDIAGVFSAEHNKQATAADNLKDLINVISHEAAHNLGLRHVTNANSGDIMARRGAIARSLDATFLDQLMNLHEAWPDNTMQNDHQALISVLGVPNPTTGILPGFNLADFFSFFTADFGSSGDIFDATIGIVDPEDPEAGVQTFTYDVIDGPIQLPVFVAPGAQFFLMGSTVDGGTVDVFSGSPTGGNLDFDDIFMNLFDKPGVPTTSSLTSGAPGNFLPFGEITVTQDMIGNFFVPGNKGTFTDSDGDVYTVKLTGGGILAMNLDDPDADGDGAIDRLVATGTKKSSKLSVTVTQVVGDGIVNIGAVSTDQLKDFKARNSDIVGSGISVLGSIKTVVIRDLINGADLLTSGAATDKTSITARTIGDDSTIDLGMGQIKKLTAAQIGDAVINASIAKLIKVTGSVTDQIEGTFSATLNLSHASPTLGSLIVTGGILDATITTAGDISKIVTPSIENSNIFVGFFDTPAGLPQTSPEFDNQEAVLKKLTVTGAGVLGDWFINSNVGAPTINKVTFGHADTTNGAMPFGFAADVFKKAIYTDALGVKTVATNAQAIIDLLTDGDMTVDIFSFVP